METAKTGSHFRHWQIVIDLITMTLGILAVMIGIFVFLEIGSRLRWLPLMFLLAALADMMSGMKAFYYGRRIAGIGMSLVAVLVFLFAIVSYITMW